jgi:hypothetical protein
LVETPQQMTYAAVQQLPRRTIQSDIHCVTRWSLLDSSWEGIPIEEIVAVGMLGQSAFAQVPVQLPPAPPDAVNPKIHFDLTEFNDDGLYGPPDGLRAAMYEFRIPARADLAAQVASIDPTVQIYASSPGRIGGGSDEYLCLGSTGQPA